MKFLFSKCSIFVVWQMLHCTDNSRLEQTACAFDFNFKVNHNFIISSFLIRNHTDKTFSKIQTGP